MREYAKVSPLFWTGKTGKALKRAGHEAVIVGLYLMTSPHANMIGVYHCPIGYIALDTGLGIEGASKGLQSCIEADFCTFEADSEYVFVHEFAAYQIGDELQVTDKRCVGVANELGKVPEGQCRQLFRSKYGAAFHLPREGSAVSPTDAPSKALRSQEQEKEQEKEQKQKKDLDPPRERGGNTRGTRLPQDWTLPKPWGLWACERGWPEAAVREEAEKFRDYWVARPGRDGTKLDWAATWRNWIRNAKPPAGVTIAATAGVVPDRWWTTPDGIEAQGLAHDLHFEPNGDPMAWIEFTARVWLAAGDGPWLRQGDETTKGAYRRLLEREGLSA